MNYIISSQLGKLKICGLNYKTLQLNMNLLEMDTRKSRDYDSQTHFQNKEIWVTGDRIIYQFDTEHL